MTRDEHEMPNIGQSRYEQIGRGYARTRRGDPRLAPRIHKALGSARTLVNVGAGTGSYEPRDRHVIAIEPSDVMASQRSAELAPAIRASAGTLDHRIFPRADLLAGWLGGETHVETVEIRRDTPDWTLGSFWAHPERVLDPLARNSTSGFARMDAAIIQRVEQAVSRDLQSGAWDQRHSHLRHLNSFDAGLRLITNTPG